MLAVTVDGRCVQYAKEPGAQVGPSLIGMGEAKCFEHGFLHQVFGFLLVVGHATSGAVKAVELTEYACFKIFNRYRAIFIDWPGWLYFLNAGEILTALAYSLATNLAESLVVLCGPLLLALVLPRKWFYDVFVARGAALSIAVLGYMMFLAEQFKNKSDYPTLSLQLWTVLLALAGIVVLVYLFGRIALLRKIVEQIADRTTIFVYILIPLSILSLLVVIVRSVVG